MKWIRSKIDENREISTGYISMQHYISMSHTSYNNHYWYTYSVNGEKVLEGRFEAASWDEAEKIVVLKIRTELSWRADIWSQRLENFDKEVNESETVD